MNVNKSYSGKNIKILDDIEAIRKYPGMYIGSIVNANHLFCEILDNSIDECMMGFCDKIFITIVNSHTITVGDNGRGIPIDKHEDGFLACELVFLKTHSGGKFNDLAYQKSGGLHGIGLSAVNALSLHLNVVIVRDGKVCELTFEKGVLCSSKISDNTENLSNGTSITFTPDPEIFESKDLVISDLYYRLQYLTYLNSNLSIHYENQITQEKEILHHEDGIKGLMSTIINGGLLKDNYFISDTKDTVSADVVMNWSDTERDDKYVTFTNCIVQRDGGTHLNGVRNGIVKFFNTLKEIDSILNDGQLLIWSDIKIGFRLVISIRMQGPKFDSQSKNRLVSSEVRKRVEHIIFNSLTETYRRTPDIFRKLIKTICDHLVLKHKLNKEGSSLSAFLYGGRLVDCRTKDRTNAELFLAEGESAGGLVKQCRNKETQALLTLRGKIINVEKANMRQIINSESLAIIASAIGGSYSADGNVVIDNLKYGKIIILVDADVDGSHIRALLLTLFYKHMQQVVLNKHIYVVVPPLYRVQIKDNSIYFNKDQELVNFLEKHIIDKYFTKLGLNNEQSSIIRVLVEVFNKHSKKLNIFLVRIIDSMFNLCLWNYESIISKVHCFEQEMKKMNCFISCYIDNKENLIIEDYSNVEKLIVSEDYFNQNVKLIVKLFKKYGSNINQLSDKLFSDCGVYLFEYTYQKWSKMNREIIIQRFKGLGEMNADQLYETSMNPKTRNLKRVVMEDCERADKICNILMGEDPELRRIFIDKNHGICSAHYDYE